MTTWPCTPGGALALRGYQPGGSSAVVRMQEAADVAGFSVSTLRQQRTEAGKAGATATSVGWRVSMTTLIATGLVHGEGSPQLSRCNVAKTWITGRPSPMGNPSSRLEYTIELPGTIRGGRRHY